jgi:hypothetical protein
VGAGYFKKGTEPKETCSAHILLEFDRATGALASEKCPSEARVMAALVKNYERAFPCPVCVTDAQYTYRHLPFGAAVSDDPSEAFFQDHYEHGVYIGHSGTEKAHNRICAEHEEMTETTETEETTATQETADPVKETGETRCHGG